MRLKHYSLKTDKSYVHWGRRFIRFQKKGVIREIYFRADRTSAVLILEGENLEEAKENYQLYR